MCPRCSHTMQGLDLRSWWCARCGTLKYLADENDKRCECVPTLLTSVDALLAEIPALGLGPLSGTPAYDRFAAALRNLREAAGRKEE